MEYITTFIWKHNFYISKQVHPPVLDGLYEFVFFTYSSKFIKIYDMKLMY